LEKLKLEFLSLHSQTDRAQAGFALERLLNQLFALFDLRPRTAVSCYGRADRRLLRVGP
jgi:hypothetical protein